jgi:hypothetical protein
VARALTPATTAAAAPAGGTAAAGYGKGVRVR